MADRLGDRPGPVGPADGERKHGAEVIIADARDPIASGSDESWLFALFAFLLALSLIVHQLWWGGFGIDARHFLVVLAALAVLRRPTSVARFLAMTALEVVAVGLDMPDVGSHTLLVLVIGATVLVHVGWTACRDRHLPDAGVLFTRIAPFLGVQLLLLYGLSALAKMNTGFFDVHTSCAAVMSRQVAWFRPPLLDGSWRIVPAIWGTVAVEAALSVLDDHELLGPRFDHPIADLPRVGHGELQQDRRPTNRQRSKQSPFRDLRRQRERRRSDGEVGIRDHAVGIVKRVSTSAPRATRQKRRWNRDLAPPGAACHESDRRSDIGSHLAIFDDSPWLRLEDSVAVRTATIDAPVKDGRARRHEGQEGGSH